MERSSESLIPPNLLARLEALEHDLQQLKETIPARVVKIEAHYCSLSNEISQLSHELHQKLVQPPPSCKGKIVWD